MTVGIEKRHLVLLLGSGVQMDSAIVQDPSSVTWFLWFETCKNKYVLRTQRGRARQFKTLDAVYKEMAGMGVSDTRIEKARPDNYKY